MIKEIVSAENRVTTPVQACSPLERFLLLSDQDPGRDPGPTRTRNMTVTVQPYFKYTPQILQDLCYILDNYCPIISGLLDIIIKIKNYFLCTEFKDLLLLISAQSRQVAELYLQVTDPKPDNVEPIISDKDKLG
jgi:hypothetical protein